MIASPYLLAERFLGQHEVTGDHDNLFILWCLSTCTRQALHDETPWCSGFANAICLLADVPRSGSLSARSWLAVGRPVALADAMRNDIVVLKQHVDDPGPEVVAARGHVTFYSSQSPASVLGLGGNQSDQVCLAPFPIERVLGVRRVM